MSEWEARWFAWVLVIATFVVFVVSSSVAGSPESFKTVGVRVPASREAAPLGPKVSDSQASDGFWLAQLALRRADAREEAPIAGRHIRSDQEDVVSGPVAVADVQPLAPHAWQPADECSKVPNLGPVWLTRNTMRWCERLTFYLNRGEELGAWTWKRGDLTRLLLIVQCESGGNPSAVNPSSGTTGLFQHRPRYWSDRGGQAARLFGFTNPTITMPYDNLATGVWLAKTGGWGHWEYCGGNWGGAPAETLRRAGLG